MRRRLAIALAACGITLASAQYPQQDPERIPSVTEPSIPLTYVGNDGSISLGINSEGRTEGQLMGVFARNDARAVVGQLWWDRAGAGGTQFDFNWLWGGDAVFARQNPDQATVSRLSFALDQNAQHARKATLGFGIERRAFSVEGWLAHGVGGARKDARTVQVDPQVVSGSDEFGNYTEVTTTTIDTLFESKPFGTEVGLQLSHVFEAWPTRVYGGASTQDGDGVRATTLSLGLDTPLGRRGWGLSARADHVQRQGMGGGSDDRLALFLRYEFGGHGSFLPTSQLDTPAWIPRALARPSNAHPRTVETYRRVRHQSVSVTREPRQYSNRFPLTQADTASAFAGAATTIDVLANDSDPDGDPLTLTAVGAAMHGSATIAGNMVVYTPAAGYSGTDSFGYTVSDGRGGNATGQISVNVGGQANRAPLARNDSATARPAQPVTIAVLANDSDPDGDTLAISAVDAPAHGSAVISGDTIVYISATSYTGSDSFSYTISDGRGGSATALVTIQVQPRPNSPPVAAADNVTVTPGTATTINVLANDHDPDGDPLTVTWIGIPSHGTATLVGNAIVYTATAAGAAGTDTFSYRITDGRGGVATARVTIAIGTLVNQPPVAVDDAATVPAGGTVTISALANDSDPDGDPLTITAFGTPTYGTVAIVGNTIVYASTSLTFLGVDRFSYTISDGRGGTATATVTVNVTTLVNQPPVAVDDAATVQSGGTGALSVLANDSDPDGDPLTITAVGAPASGTAAIVGNTIVYTSGTAVGLDRFPYTISDGRGGTATAFINVNVTTLVNQPPVAVDDSANVQNGATVSINVLANDFDPEGGPLTITAVGAPSYGSASIVGGTIVYASNATFAVVDVFTYTISDPQGATATATVRVNVSTAVNNPPVAQPDVVTTPMNTPIMVNALANDTDPDGDALTIIAVTQPANGTATITPNGILYTPNTGFYGSIDVFSYTISDGRGGTATAQVGVYVSG